MNDFGELYKALVETGKADRLKYEYVDNGHACKKYKVLDNPDCLRTDEIIAIVDKGGINFGYRIEPNDIYVVYID